MPSININAQVLMGASGGGQGPLSIDGVIPAPLVGVNVSNARFRSVDKVIYQRCPTSGCIIEQYDMTTGAVSTVAHRGANWLQAGLGRWAVRTQGLGDSSYTDALGNVQKNWRPLNVDPLTGAIYIQFDYNTGYGLGRVTAGGNVANTLLSATVTEAAAWDGNWVAKILPGRLAYSFAGLGPVTRNTPNVTNIQIAGTFVVGNGTHGLLLLDLPNGRYAVISKTGTDFWPSITKLSNQHYVIATSKTSGERPQDITVYNIDPASLEWISMSIPEIPPAPPSTCLPPHQYPLWIMPYQAVTDRWGDDLQPVGNGVLITTESADELPAITVARAKRAASQGYKAMITDPQGYDPSFAAIVVGFWVGAAGMAELRTKVEAVEAKIRARELPDVPLVLYNDTGNIWVQESWMDPLRHWISPQLYRDAQEPLDVFEDHCVDIVDTWNRAGFKVLPTWHAYDRNGEMTEAEMMETQKVLPTLVELPGVIGFLPFTDMRQGTDMGGMNFYPDLKNELRRYDVAQPEDRPNRFSYWAPRLTSKEDVLRNQLGQDRELVALSRAQKDFILDSLHRLQELE